MSNDYLTRDKDGILCVNLKGAFHARYKEPDEAIKTWSKGALRIGCKHSVYHFMGSNPCGNPAKYDPDHNGNPTKCGHHSAAAHARKKAKQAERDAELRRKMDRSKEIHALNAEREQIIQKIADGHNDPRSLCADWLRRKAEFDD